MTFFIYVKMLHWKQTCFFTNILLIKLCTCFVIKFLKESTPTISKSFTSLYLSIIWSMISRFVITFEDIANLFAILAIRESCLFCSSGLRFLTKWDFLASSSEMGHVPVDFAASLHKILSACSKPWVNQSIDCWIYKFWCGGCFVYIIVNLHHWLPKSWCKFFLSIGARNKSNIWRTCVVWLGRMRTWMFSFRNAFNAWGFSRETCPSRIKSAGLFLIFSGNVCLYWESQFRK